jgi:uncharacterized protein (DUF2147 family)
MNIRLGLLAGLLLWCGPACAQDDTAIVGQWVVPDGSAVISIEENPLDHSFQGTIIALQNEEFVLADGMGVPGEPRLDINNPRRSDRGRPVKGLVILVGLSFDGESWSGGEIYDPVSGSTYSCRLELVNGEFLKLRGYLGISLLGRTMYWQRLDTWQRQVTAFLQKVHSDGKS